MLYQTRKAQMAQSNTSPFSKTDEGKKIARVFKGQQIKVAGAIQRQLSETLPRQEGSVQFYHPSSIEPKALNVRKIASTPEELERCKSEKQILRIVKGEGIQKLIESAEDQLITEFAGKDLFKHREHAVKKFDTDSVGVTVERFYPLAQQFFSALQHIHSCNVWHLDLKPENVFISDDEQLTIGDFGLAIDVNNPPEEAIGFTPGFKPPEVVTGGPITEQADTYSASATLYELLTGRPFIRMPINESIYKDQETFEQYRDTQLMLVGKIAPEAIPFFKSTLTWSYEKRTSILDAIEMLKQCEQQQRSEGTSI